MAVLLQDSRPYSTSDITGSLANYRPATMTAFGYLRVSCEKRSIDGSTPKSEQMPFNSNLSARFDRVDIIIPTFCCRNFALLQLPVILPNYSVTFSYSDSLKNTIFQTDRDNTL